MKLWIDAQLSPALAAWLRTTLHVEAVSLKEIGLRDADDAEIFQAARVASAVVMTKDVDFCDLVARHGPPPQVIWITCGNTSNARLQQILGAGWATVASLLAAGEPLVELGDEAR